MIQPSELKFASAEVIARAKLCRAYERGNQVYVKPQIPMKENRIVIFLREGILCVATDGEACPANDHGRYCYHTLAANRRREINKKSRATRAKNLKPEKQRKDRAA